MNSIEEGQEVSKNCPNGEHEAVKLVIRKNSKTGYLFLGCPKWPDCGYTEKLPEELKMKLEGHQQLPGF